MTPVPLSNPRGVGTWQVEGNRWLLTLIGTAGHFPPTDEAGFAAVVQLGGHGIKVGAGPTLATHRCDTPAALLAWLETALAQQPQGAGADTPASGRTTA